MNRHTYATLAVATSGVNLGLGIATSTGADIPAAIRLTAGAIGLLVWLLLLADVRRDRQRTDGRR